MRTRFRDNLTAHGAFRIVRWQSVEAYRESCEETDRTRNPRAWEKYAQKVTEQNALLVDDPTGMNATRNALVQVGVNHAMSTMAALLYAIIGTQIQVSATEGVYGGPASLAGNNLSYIGVGDAQTVTQLNGASNAGDLSVDVDSVSGLTAGDQILLSDATTAYLGTNPETAYIASISTLTLTLTQPLRWGHLDNTKVYRHGSKTDVGLPTGADYYKGIDTGYPVQGVNGDGHPSLIWQATFSNSGGVGVNEAAFAWKALMIGKVRLNVTPPGAGDRTLGTGTAPSNSTVLAVGTRVPIDLADVVDKTADDSVISIQYELPWDLGGS